jgi:N-succinyldiaminopimelate aminotransferase
MRKRTEMEVVVPALRPFGTSIFTEMTVLAQAHKAVNLSQGFPDFDGPEDIRRRAAEAILRGPNQYALSYGIPAFRHAVAQKMKRLYGVEVDPDQEVTVTSGATEGICATLFGILERGDEIILLEPCYDSYPPIAALTGATIRYVSLSPPDFALPREELERAFGPKTKAILINNPQNPCGKVFTREELEFLAALCVRHDAFFIADEVYEYLVYDGRPHVTLLSLPEAADRAFVISSTAKTFSMTGWKVGYVVARAPLSRAVRMSHQFITFCGQAPLQEAMAYAIGLPDTYYHQLLSDYTRRRDLLGGALEDMGFQVYPTQGTYYTIVDIRSLGYGDDLEFCRMLPEKAGVAAIPCSVFWENRHEGRHLVRFCFCKKTETLEEAILRLRRWLK